MKRDINTVKQILTILADYPKRLVPLASFIKVKDLDFHLSLMQDNKYLVVQTMPGNQNYYEVYMTWKGYDFFESLNREIELAADYQKDMIEILNENIIKEIDKQECDKILNSLKFPFIVFEMYSDYDIIKDANFVHKFNSRSEAEAFIKDAKDKYIESCIDKMEYVKNYINSATDDQMINIYTQTDSTLYHEDKMRYVIVQYLFDSKKQYDFEGYNPPQILPSNSQYYHILEIKED